MSFHPREWRNSSIQRHPESLGTRARALRVRAGWVKDVCAIKAWRRGNVGLANRPQGSDLELEIPGLGLA